MIVKRKAGIPIALAVILGSLTITAIVLGQVSGTLDLSWSTIAGGGGQRTEGRYTVTGSPGQAVASNAPSTDGDRYSLTDGFWQPGLTQRTVYLPIAISRGS